MKDINKRSIGTEYEKLAKEHLQKNGVVILEENFRNRFGEIDIIGRDGDYLVFFEVKYRSNLKLGHPLEAVNYAKQKQISRVSDYYRVIKKIGDFAPMRFDVIAIFGSEITWIKNAFYYVGKK